MIGSFGIRIHVRTIRGRGGAIGLFCIPERPLPVTRSSGVRGRASSDRGGFLILVTIGTPKFLAFHFVESNAVFNRRDSGITTVVFGNGFLVKLLLSVSRCVRVRVRMLAFSVGCAAKMADRRR